MAVLNSFDRISGVYDLLARIVFGKSITKAQTHFLHHIPAKAKVLILGGGTGWLLAEVLKAKPNCEVWYIEASAKMIALSRSKVNNDERVHFIHGTESDIPTQTYFDVVITNFYLDLFSETDLQKTLGLILASVKPKAQWLATDFANEGKQWQQLLLMIMYTFFKLTCGLKTSHLPDWKKALFHEGLIRTELKKFHNGFIESAFFELASQ